MGPLMLSAVSLQYDISVTSFNVHFKTVYIGTYNINIFRYVCFVGRGYTIEYSLYTHKIILTCSTFYSSHTYRGIKHMDNTSKQERLNLLKVVGAQLTNKTHFYCEKLNSYEHLKILWRYVSPVPSGSFTYANKQINVQRQDCQAKH